MKYVRIITLLNIAIILFTQGLVSIWITNSNAQNAETNSIVYSNGFKPSRIDGVIDESSSSSTIPEWGDAQSKELIFESNPSTSLLLDQNSVKQVKSAFLSKWVNGKYQMALQVPEKISEFELQIDFDQDNTLSNGDVKISSEKFLPNSKDQNWMDLSQIASTTDLMIYHDGLWTDPFEINPKQWDRNNWFPDDKNWDGTKSNFVSYTELVSKISQITFGSLNPKLGDNSGTNIDNIELSFDQTAYRSFLELTMQSSLPDITKINMLKLNYGIILQTELGNKLGYPSMPSTSKNGQETWITGFDIINAIELSSKFSVNLRLDHIEVTQAVQTTDNALSLIKNKETVVRVFVDGPKDQLVNYEVRLGGVILALPIVNLGVITESAISLPRMERQYPAFEFRLPETWLESPMLILNAEVVPVDLHESDPSDNYLSQAVFFKETYDMNIYYIRPNLGYRYGDPVQANYSDTNGMLSHFKTVFPMANPNFIELGWNELGHLNGRFNPHSILISLKLLAYQIMLNTFQYGEAEVPYPDQIYAIMPYASGNTAGLSSPKWYDSTYSGMTSWGTSEATNHMLVMAHEINHNLGDNNWGRHVGNNTYQANDKDWGCGASGTDTGWPSTNQNIYQNYPSTIAYNMLTNRVSPELTIDFMSYCASVTPPHQWISDYRWEALTYKFQNFVRSIVPSPKLIMQSENDLLSQSSLSIKPDFTLASTRIISGEIYINQSVDFDISYRLPGHAINLPTVAKEISPTHQLEIDFVNQTTMQYPFYADFVGDSHIDNGETFHFSFMLPDNGEIIELRIIDMSGNALATLVGSSYSLEGLNIDHQPTITRNELFNVKLSPVNLQNSSNIYFQLQYSHDGTKYINLGEVNTDLSFDLYIDDNIPGGLSGKFRVIVTDGFESKIFMGSETVSLAPVQPQIEINYDLGIYTDYTTVNFENPTKILDTTVGSSISLSADAFDPQNGKVNADQIYWVITRLSDNSQSEAVFGKHFNYQFHQSGDFEIKAIIPDSANNIVSDSIRIVVKQAAQVSVDAYNIFRQELEVLTNSDVSETKTTSESTSSNKKSDAAFISAFTFGQSILILAVVLVPLFKHKQK
ncbi:MAG: hypothetical protein GPJ54_21300 [Candidatus Heimdallarchaeota archaeon]|nr:hypothetical protein [Candidatus Heimdallarchaeota archaeon]